MRHIRPLSVFREGGTDILQEHQQQTWQCPELCAFTSGLRKWTVMSFVVASHQTISRPRFWGTIRTGISGLVANLPACRCWFDDVDGMGKKSNNLIPSPIPPCPTKVMKIGSCITHVGAHPTQYQSKRFLLPFPPMDHLQSA